MRVAYFINQYPGVSHTFIRREIHAMEGLGVSIVRYALRAGANLVDDADKSEARRSRYILEARVGEWLRCCVAALVAKPRAVFTVIRLALLMARRSDRGIWRHLAYAAEAAVLADWCKRDGAQHIHAHFGTNSAAIAMLASLLSGIPYSFTAHGSEEFDKAPLLSLPLKLQHAAFAVCVSAFGRSQLMRLSSPDQWDKIAIVHCGLDNEYLAPTAGDIPSTPRFVCVGRLCPEKAQLVLISAARRLREAGIHCEIVLGGDGAMREEVEAAIAQAGLQETVTITGWIPGERVRLEIQTARALVLPSFSENMPVSIMEAMALGRPVISTYVAGIPELVQPGKTGWLVPAGDDDALARAMREALAAPTAQLAAMGAAGRCHVLNKHGAAQEARKLKGLIEASLCPQVCDQARTDLRPPDLYAATTS
jgi:glycosyltransferase involved in cell wall biosynthesis